MLPPRLTGRWQALKPEQRSLKGVSVIEAATPAEEAQAIAIRLRETLETPERTAALVTPDRALATRVSAHLQRWGIEADDSAGQPLSRLPPGTLLMALAGVLAEGFAPVALLALLKHPLVRAGEGRLLWLDQVRRLDLVLRGPRPAAGLAAITALIEAENGLLKAARAGMKDWWRALVAELAPIEALHNGEAPLSAILEAVRATASSLSGDRVWAGNQGHAAAQALGSLADAALHGPALVDAVAAASILGQALGAVSVRPPQGGHPRIAILGLIEAQLQQADVMILAGLNEGSWPNLPTPDPWLAPSVRAALGLPSLEQKIGLAAHDFANGLGAPTVLLSRARRDVSAPTVASRFWLRLRAMAGDAWVEDKGLIALARIMDAAPAQPRARQPAPMPPEGKRPHDIAVTDVDRLRADPYAFYAAKILHLPRLDPVDADPGPAWRGTRAHDVLERWMKEGAPGPDRLRDLARQMIADAPAHPLLRALWQPRLLAGLDWVASEVAVLAQEGRHYLFGEEWGHIMRGGVKLRGKPDRIDRLADGSLAIVDYKSGHAPSVKQTEAGFALQLGLLGLIAQGGGFPQLPDGGTVSAYEYWATGKKEKGRIGTRKVIAEPGGGRGRIAADEMLPMIARFFDEAAARWLMGSEPFTARPNPDAPVFDTYDQLMRLDEWYARGGTAEGEGQGNG
jgi:ATP-dependent helicase/nuclease subunit B